MVSRRSSGAGQTAAGNKTSVLALPAEILELIYSFLEDADDVASCHMVDTRCVCMLQNGLAMHGHQCALRVAALLLQTTSFDSAFSVSN